ncbi:MAG: acyl-ACP--UDP-N-acetylglucosamine O-acyltransferase [Nitrospirae bacterium]|nr:MAG: acyl-ACP--UDP-N-acetylglucosamine O-acyltransferase [Nitrospirota bacterium]
MNIHPTALVHPKAEIEEDVVIGPYCVIGEHVKIGRGSRLISHVYIEGHTEIGQRCQIFPYVSIGTPPQHLQYRDEPTRVILGDDNIVREYVTINRATSFGGGITRLGHHNFLMAYVHIAHDCELGNHVVMANAATLAGHITIGNYAVIGGLVGVHQYVRIGDYAMIGGCSALGRDVPPFMRAAGGYRAKLFGLNSIALRRHGFSNERIAILRQAYDLLFRQGYRLNEATKLARSQYSDSTDVLMLLTFIESSRRGLCHASSRDLDDEEL